MVYYPVPWLSVNLCARRENEGELSTIVPLTIYYRLVKAPLSFPFHGLCFNNNLEEDWHQFWRTTQETEGTHHFAFVEWTTNDQRWVVVGVSTFHDSNLMLFTFKLFTFKSYLDVLLNGCTSHQATAKAIKVLQVQNHNAAGNNKKTYE
ncbi:hypothetical protein HELRODRAFT_160482 [Helobdella robusta]|uniref:Uncharacterized protein n=1 Tax=Helobdella robusta TaxID=6412 RepID=T1EQB0_HELRO|nr:hypothetical protein HELRODRAFT_160482 [Helobdella robusta]ESO06318.1 hypothetical protein HELRODRAFT_160482 [Helobdella robusta]